MRSESPQSAHLPQDGMKRPEEDCAGRRRQLRTRILTIATREEARRKQQDGGAYISRRCIAGWGGLYPHFQRQGSDPCTREKQDFQNCPIFTAKLASSHPPKKVDASRRSIHNIRAQYLSSRS